MRFALAVLSVTAFVTFASCSEPVPQSPDGAFWLNTSQPDATTCKIVGQVAQVGQIDAQEKPTTITDGANGASVTCTILGQASPFNVHGVINDNAGSFLEIDVNPITPSASDTSPALGTVTFSASWTSGNPYSGQCKFYFEKGSRETVDVGRIWVSFQCDALTSQQSTCPLRQGYAIFENCLTEDTTQ